MNIANITELIKEKRIETPSYVLDMDALKSHIEKVCEIADSIGGEKIELCYAMKANPLMTNYFSDKVHHIEVCSPGEFEICKLIGIPGDKIILSGVNKNTELIRNAMEYGVDIITIESLRQYAMLKESLDAHADIKVKILPRLSNGAQFGMSEKDLEHVISDSANDLRLDVVGIHYFTGTQKKSIDKNKEEIDTVVELIDGLKASYGFSPALFEYGAGLKTPYFTGDDFEDIYADLSELLRYIAGLNLDYVVGIELGRYFAFNSMYYCTAVDDIKVINDTNICIVDGGIHQVNYYGQNMAMRTPIIDHIKMDTEQAERRDDDISSDTAYAGNSDEKDWRVCGSLCTFADILVRKISLVDLQIGDVLLFRNVGAYSMTESPALFLSRDLPYVYSYSESEGLELIRDVKDTYRINVG